MAGRIAAVLGFAIVALALVSASQPAPEPTILAVVIEVQSNTVKILSAKAVRGEIREHGPESLTGIASGPNDWLVEYVYKASGGTAKVLQTGVLHVPLQPIIEEPRREPLPAELAAPPPATKRVVMFVVPDVSGATELSFSRLTPVAGVPPDKWTRTPLGQSPLPPVRR